MKPLHITPKNLLITAAAAILLTNTVVLARVACNRSGDPQTWTFTERELHSNRYRFNSRENSSLILRLDWQGTPPDRIEGTVFWSKRRNIKVDKATLEALDFPTEYNCKQGDGRKYDRRHNRVSEKAWIALEYNGPTHQNHIETLENHRSETEARYSKDLTEERRKELKSMQDHIDDVKTEDSRLYAVDAAPDRQTLEQRYADSEVHLIQPATVMPWLHCDKPVEVYVVDVLTSSVYVPRRYRKGFDGYDDWRAHKHENRPIYQVGVAYGRLAEPWVQSVAPMTDSSIPSE